MAFPALTADAPDQVAIELVEALTDAGMSSAIGGALALGFFGEPRGTKDVDLDVFVGEDRYEEMFDVLERAGCTFDRDACRRQARDGNTIVVVKDGFRVDLFVPTIPFYAEAEARRTFVTLRGRRVPILSAECLCVFKLLFFRPKDLLDIEKMVALQQDALDHAYVRRWIVAMVGEDDPRVERWDAIVSAFGAGA